MNIVSVAGAPRWVQYMNIGVGFPAFLLIILGNFQVVSSTVQAVAAMFFLCVFVIQIAAVVSHYEGYRDRG